MGFQYSTSFLFNYSGFKEYMLSLALSAINIAPLLGTNKLSLHVSFGPVLNLLSEGHLTIPIFIYLWLFISSYAYNPNAHVY